MMRVPSEYRRLPNLRNFLIQGSAQNSTFLTIIGFWENSNSLGTTSQFGSFLFSAVYRKCLCKASAIGEKTSISRFRCLLWLRKSCGDGNEGVGNRNEQEFKQIPSFSRVARDRNEFKFLRKESAILGKVCCILLFS
jgi:hypothetical protein